MMSEQFDSGAEADVSASITTSSSLDISDEDKTIEAASNSEQSECDRELETSSDTFVSVNPSAAVSTIIADDSQGYNLRYVIGATTTATDPVTDNSTLRESETDDDVSRSTSSRTRTRTANTTSNTSTASTIASRTRSRLKTASSTTATDTDSVTNDLSTMSMSRSSATASVNASAAVVETDVSATRTANTNNTRTCTASTIATRTRSRQKTVTIASIIAPDSDNPILRQSEADNATYVIEPATADAIDLVTTNDANRMIGETHNAIVKDETEKLLELELKATEQKKVLLEEELARIRRQKEKEPARYTDTSIRKLMTEIDGMVSKCTEDIETAVRKHRKPVSSQDVPVAGASNEEPQQIAVTKKDEEHAAQEIYYELIKEKLQWRWELQDSKFVPPIYTSRGRYKTRVKMLNCVYWPRAYVEDFKYGESEVGKLQYPEEYIFWDIYRSKKPAKLINDVYNMTELSEYMTQNEGERPPPPRKQKCTGSILIPFNNGLRIMYPCRNATCGRIFTNESGRAKHERKKETIEEIEGEVEHGSAEVFYHKFAKKLQPGGTVVGPSFEPTSGLDLRIFELPKNLKEENDANNEA